MITKRAYARTTHPRSGSKAPQTTAATGGSLRSISLSAVVRTHASRSVAAITSDPVASSAECKMRLFALCSERAIRSKSTSGRRGASPEGRQSSLQGLGSGDG